MAQNAAQSTPLSIYETEKLALGNHPRLPPILGALTSPTDHCRWLFNQDVRIITFSKPSSSPVYRTFSAIVVPKSCTLLSLARCGNNDLILLKVDKRDTPLGLAPTRNLIIHLLLDWVMGMIGETMEVDEYGSYHVAKSSLPLGYRRKLHQITDRVDYEC